jgi:hypothetical protein
MKKGFPERCPKSLLKSRPDLEQIMVSRIAINGNGDPTTL